MAKLNHRLMMVVFIVQRFVNVGEMESEKESQQDEDRSEQGEESVVTDDVESEEEDEGKILKAIL